MQFTLRGLAAVLALSALLTFAGSGHAQAVYVAPAPAVSYYTPAVSYYAAPSASVTTYRYGILPRRQVTVTNYYTPTYVYP